MSTVPPRISALSSSHLRAPTTATRSMCSEYLERNWISFHRAAQSAPVMSVRSARMPIVRLPRSRIAISSCGRKASTSSAVTFPLTFRPKARPSLSLSLWIMRGRYLRDASPRRQLRLMVSDVRRQKPHRDDALQAAHVRMRDPGLAPAVRLREAVEENLGALREPPRALLGRWRGGRGPHLPRGPNAFRVSAGQHGLQEYPPQDSPLPPRKAGTEAAAAVDLREHRVISDRQVLSDLRGGPLLLRRRPLPLRRRDRADRRGAEGDRLSMLLRRFRERVRPSHAEG